MIDKNQRKVLSVLNQLRKERTPFSEIELYNKTRIFDRYKMVKLCQELNDLGYFDAFAITTSSDITNISLSYKGLMYLSLHRQQRRKRAFDWFSEHIVEFAALILSVISLLLVI